MLELMKYRMYTCDIERDFPGNNSQKFIDSLIISKEDLSSIVGKKIKLADLENYIYITLRRTTVMSKEILNSVCNANNTDKYTWSMYFFKLIAVQINNLINFTR